MTKKNSCAFTGHRPRKFPWKYNEDDERCIALKAVLTEQITLLADKGVTVFLSGMAMGVDLWCAEIVLALRKKNPALQLQCILPCEGQESQWPASEQDRYRSILDQADSVVYVSRDYHKDCMLERNRFLVDHAGLILSVYNGERRGGTAATVRYAKKVKRDCIVIDPATLRVSHEPSHDSGAESSQGDP